MTARASLSPRAKQGRGSEACAASLVLECGRLDVRAAVRACERGCMRARSFLARRACGRVRVRLAHSGVGA
eukprot:1234512-Pleurochrysis_carterae.AAC.2